MRKYFLISVLFLSSCTWFGRGEITVGEFSSLSGSEASFGKSTHQGILMAFNKANSDGGVLGKKLRLVTKDTQSSKEVTIRAVNELIKKNKVIALLGEVASDRSSVAASLAQIHKIPMLTPASTSPGITDLGKFVFRSCYIDPMQGAAMAKFAFHELGLRKVAIIRNGTSNYSSGLAEFFSDKFETLGGKVVADEAFSPNDPEYGSILKRIRRHEFQGLFLPLYYANILEIAGHLPRSHGWKLLGGDGWDSEGLKESAVLNGAYFTTHFSLELKSTEALGFIEEYRKRFGEDPDATAALGYDAAQLLIEAIRKSDTAKPEDIRNSLQKISDFKGVTGTIGFDSDRNAVKPIHILQLQKDRARLIKTVD